MKYIFLGIALIMSCTSCETSCDDALCDCTAIELEFQYDNPAAIEVRLEDQEGVVDNDDLSYFVSKSDTSILISLNGNLSVAPIAQYMILLNNTANNEVDTVKNFEYQTYDCEENFCGNQRCVTINENLNFDINGKGYSITELPLSLNIILF